MLNVIELQSNVTICPYDFNNLKLLFLTKGYILKIAKELIIFVGHIFVLLFLINHYYLKTICWGDKGKPFYFLEIFKSKN